jgi:dihydroorotase
MLTLIKNVILVNEGNRYKSDVLIENQRIKKIATEISINADKIINATGLHLLPFVFDPGSLK